MFFQYVTVKHSGEVYESFYFTISFNSLLNNNNSDKCILYIITILIYVFTITNELSTFSYTCQAFGKPQYGMPIQVSCLNFFNIFFLFLTAWQEFFFLYFHGLSPWHVYGLQNMFSLYNTDFLQFLKKRVLSLFIQVFFTSSKCFLLFSLQKSLTYFIIFFHIYLFIK